MLPFPSRIHFTQSSRKLVAGGGGGLAVNHSRPRARWQWGHSCGNLMDDIPVSNLAFLGCKKRNRLSCAEVFYRMHCRNLIRLLEISACSSAFGSGLLLGALLWLTLRHKVISACLYLAIPCSKLKLVPVGSLHVSYYSSTQHDSFSSGIGNEQ